MLQRAVERVTNARISRVVVIERLCCRRVRERRAKAASVYVSAQNLSKMPSHTPHQHELRQASRMVALQALPDLLGRRQATLRGQAPTLLVADQQPLLTEQVA
ncbi:hypothetical protein RZS08_35380 [Arthrospira platensis SPKY1]|nr:hypothetical protein [Arthrospira platensis SPKY1]